MNTSAEMMDLLAKSDRIGQTMTRKLVQFALGRPLVASDANELDRIHSVAAKNGGTYVSVMIAIVTSDLVLRTRTESSQ